MNMIRCAIAMLAAAMAYGSASLAAAADFKDPLAVPARDSALASRGLLQGIVRTRSQLVAVGQRGHIITSADDGGAWQQAAVPVSSDLTAVFFVNERKGWAVGHDGVVLHTADGGLHWVLQLDGRRANELLVHDLADKVRARPESADLQRLLTEAKRFQAQGADKPFMDVWFADELNGYVVGAYNLIFRTADGGASWEPWFDRTDNPKLLSLYAIARTGSGLYVVGEGGLVLRLDPKAQRFQALPTPYAGSYFGVIGTAGSVMAFGLRGNAYRSDDGGRRWDKLDTGLAAAIVAGTSLPGGALVLADAGGRVAVSDPAGREFKVVPLKTAMPITGIAAAGNDRLAWVGLRGVAVSALPAR
jgi:photosystem II stability/assembly factor-like uncharacterized protein